MCYVFVLTRPLTNKINARFQEAMGMRIKKLHFISGSKFFDTVISVMKQGLSKKIAGRIVVHDSVESIHEFISKDILPKEYGGKEKSLNELNGEPF